MMNRVDFFRNMVGDLKKAPPFFYGEWNLLFDLIFSVSGIVNNIMNKNKNKSEEMKLKVTLRVFEILCFKIYWDVKWDFDLLEDRVRFIIKWIEKEYRLSIENIIKKLKAINSEIKKYNAIIVKRILLDEKIKYLFIEEDIYFKSVNNKNVLSLADLNLDYFPDLKVKSGLLMLLDSREEVLLDTVSLSFFLWQIPFEIYNEIKANLIWIRSNEKIKVSIVEWSIKRAILEYIANKFQIKLSNYLFPNELEIDKIDNSLLKMDLFWERKDIENEEDVIFFEYMYEEIILEIIKEVSNVFINEDKLSQTNPRYMEWYLERLKYYIRKYVEEIFVLFREKWSIKEAFITSEDFDRLRKEDIIIDRDIVLDLRKQDELLLKDLEKYSEADLKRLFLVFEDNNSYLIKEFLLNNSITLILKISMLYYDFLLDKYWDSDWLVKIKQFLKRIIKFSFIKKKCMFVFWGREIFWKFMYNRWYRLLLYLWYWLKKWKLTKISNLDNYHLWLTKEISDFLDELLNEIYDDGYYRFLESFINDIQKNILIYTKREKSMQKPRILLGCLENFEKWN